MAIISTNVQSAEVVAMGEALDATMEFSPAMMEMLSSVYSYILLAGIREAIQNACDAAKRAGLTFSEGVLVLLPTPSNPMITVIDKGSGMTKHFMGTGYMSFGSSTKAGSNTEAGGLGIGRWAAYGYIRECYITTCHASDMVERTYFQFQGADGGPKAQLASEVPGTVVGTQVRFPVKDSDIAEALRAVAWLKEVMQLTMGDSFTVDAPASLPTMLPAFNGTVLTLDAVDSGLKGVRIFPMKGNLLKYGRQSLQDGSLVVLSNQEAGVGGLPFHVQSPDADESVFRNGMVVEIPMSFNVGFMPSREEIKYTDEVTALLRRIDAAAAKAIVLKAEELFNAPDLHSKAKLSDLLGNESEAIPHWFARAARASTNPESPLKKPLMKVTGGSTWSGSMFIPVVPEMRSDTLSVKSTSKFDQVLREAFSDGGLLAVSFGAKAGSSKVTFYPNNPFTLVVNDLKSGGTARFRKYLDESAKAGSKFVFLTSNVAGEAQAAAEALNARFSGVIEVIRTSSMPAAPRVVLGSAVVASRSSASSLTYYCTTQGKQMTDTASFATYDPSEPVRVWLGKDGGALAGFKADVNLSGLTDRYGDGNLNAVLGAKKLNRLYLLTPKQQAELEKATASVKADGLWEMAADDFSDDEDGRDAMLAVKALKAWVTVEELLSQVVSSKAVQDTLAGRKVYAVTESWELNKFCEVLAKRPRMELTGTKLDKALAPHIDLLTGISRIHLTKDLNQDYRKLCCALDKLGNCLEVSEHDSDDRKELVANLKRIKQAGSVDYAKVLTDLRDQFPLLKTLGQNLHAVGDVVIDDLVRALAALYR